MGKLKSAANSFFTALEREKVWLAFMATMLVLMAVYRVELGIALYSYSSELVSLQDNLQGETLSFWLFLKTLISDLCIISLLGLCLLGLKRCLPQTLKGSVYFNIVEAGIAVAALILLALMMRTHYQLLLALDTGLTLKLMEMESNTFGFDDFFRMMTLGDVIFLLIPLLIFFPALIWSKWLARWGSRIFCILAVMILAVQLVPTSQKIPVQIALNPVAYFLSDLSEGWFRSWFPINDSYVRRTDMPSTAQMHSIRLIDSAFVNKEKHPLVQKHDLALTINGKSWNILIFVLESTGANYVFDTSAGNLTPMPFLQKMAHEGLYLANHRSSANNSAKAALSIFTGLYPDPTADMFAMAKVITLPTLNDYLPADYEYFLVHPTEPGYYFPESLFLNNGLHDFYNMETLPPAHRPAMSDLARNEIDCLDFLQARLDRAHEPFLGVYWSFLPHYPYSDYGSEFRILPGDTKRERYYNNLRALDVQLRNVYEHLVKTGMADRTLFVFIGDHGEAFGQHAGVWGHGFGKYDEMYHVPAIFWQPKLISPQVVNFPTSHVDITPTLLDLLGIPYDPSRFQGESILNGPPSRKYIFTMDAYANYICSINSQMNKVAVCFGQDGVADFNLAKDPGEQFPLRKNNCQDQVEAIIKFRNYQSQLIEDYNKAIRLKQPFPPTNVVQLSSEISHR